MAEIRQRDDGILNSIRMIAPGTPLREGLDNILRAKTGALIAVGDNPEIMALVDGGFFINSEFTPAHLYELAKMDGGIILSYDTKKILYANTQFIPDPSIPSSETGIRHRTAERVARQTGEMVISISQRRNIITLYKGYSKYIVKDSSSILSKANQAIQTLEKYKAVLDRAKVNLTSLEYEDLVTILDVATVIQRTEMVLRISHEIEKYLIELGNEGRLISMQMEELVANVREDGTNIIRDYSRVQDDENYNATGRAIRNLSSEELLDLAQICRLLGYEGDLNSLETPVSPKGYRLLSKIPRLPAVVIENLVKEFEGLNNIMTASIHDLDEVEGIGEVRAHIIKEGLKRLQEQVLLDRII
ncbi:MAG: DNA integrity scanning protein DisA [Firmicutes bacterium]|nr:DNA integrity scanning protein DisA [Bacillota bacterium]MDI6706469.1 DNA integrity scanning diadenylate cyclase DisA [Bacillota bacterium]